MREPVTEEQLDDLVLGAGTATPHERHDLAERFRTWADEPHPLDEVSPRELLTQAGEQHELAGDDEAALELYRRAAASPGPVALDPRCLVIHLLHRRGEHDQADELEQRLRRSRPRQASTYEYMGEVCVELGETARALGWFNRGITLAEDEGLLEAEMGGLCLARWRLRERLGHDPDQYDEFGRDHHARLLRDLPRT
ncbi:hypothetical protein [Ornithinimicrobium pekingense]|uniref:Tetratricopeptide repeat protein n=1 Tax=Ornithinimicrobium pekingense TaxID=384677 RepID=A0ABQ2FCM2_9MICO|nr:hypothetical protein [Ornithinimicrobium pekingense]GGK75921.1 hypothetical protein GCM10011509_25640 [Ornithinimicrobium pekingense]